MRKLLLFVFLLLLNISAFSQSDVLSRITLVSGESYTGHVVLQNAETVMLQTVNGVRYQFPAADVASIKPLSAEKKLDDTDDNSTPSGVCGMLEISGGGAVAADKFHFALPVSVAMAFGAKQIAKMPLFAGLGLGYSLVYSAENKEIIGFVPIFLRLKYNKTDKRTAPYFLLDGGYAVGISKDYGGGLYAKTSTGVQVNFSEQSAFFAGAFFGVQSFRGSLIDVRENQQFNYRGTSSIVSFGLHCGLQF
jgi:hypothetical protein